MLKPISTPQPTFTLTQLTDTSKVWLRLSPTTLHPGLFSTNLSCVKSPLRAPKPPITGVDLWLQKYENLCSRINLTHRVHSNLQQLRQKTELDYQTARQNASQKEQKIEEMKKERENSWKRKAKSAQKHRDLVLKRVKTVGNTQERESAEAKAWSESPIHETKTRLCQAKTQEMMSNNSNLRVAETDVSLKLAEIEEKLKNGVKRAQENKQVVSLSARNRTASVDAKTRKKHFEALDIDRIQREKLEFLKQSSLQHLRNKETRLIAERQRLSAKRGVKEDKARQVRDSWEAGRKEREVRQVERWREREEGVRKLMEAKALENEQKHQENDTRLQEQQHALRALNEMNLVRKEQILTHHAQSERNLRFIRKVQQQIRQLQI